MNKISFQNGSVRSGRNYYGRNLAAGDLKPLLPRKIPDPYSVCVRRALGLEGWRAGWLEGWRAGWLEGWRAGQKQSAVYDLPARHFGGDFRTNPQPASPPEAAPWPG
jgi:hypothetical protein